MSHDQTETLKKFAAPSNSDPADDSDSSQGSENEEAAKTVEAQATVKKATFGKATTQKATSAKESTTKTQSLSTSQNTILSRLKLTNIFLAIVVLCMLSLFAFAGFFYYSFQKVSVSDPDQTTAFSESDPDEPDKPRAFNIALLGHGGPGHDGGRLTDSIMIVSIDPTVQKIFMISVPRDLWVPLNVIDGAEPQNWKINAAYAIGSDDNNYRQKPEEYTGEAGGGSMAKDALTLVSGLEIDRFAAIDFQGFMTAIDELGGIDVDVQKSFTDPLYPIPGREEATCGKSEEEVAATATMPAHLAEKEFPCRFETLYFPAGVIRMDSETALKYARSRHSPEDGGDFNRAARQRQVILAVKNKVLALNFVPKIIPLVSQLSNHVKTDLSVADMQALIDRQAELLEYEVVGIALTTDDDNILTFGVGGQGQSIVRPKTGIDDWESVHAWIKEQFETSEPVDDISPEKATTSAKVVDVVINRPPETVEPISNQDLSELKLELSSSSLTLKSDGDWSDTYVYALLKDSYGNIIPNQEGVSFEWRIKDDTLAEIRAEDNDDACSAEVEQPCPNMRLEVKPQKTGESKITVKARYNGADLPTPVLTLQLTVEAE